MTGSALQHMPLFPLYTVLFPSMTLPLHVFEPRYRLMIHRCIKLNRPFGVVLIQEGSEVGVSSVPYQVGTSAYITSAEHLPDGRMNIQTVGYKRFKIQGYQQVEPFMIGLVEDFPIEGIHRPAARQQAAQLRAPLRTYLERVARATQTEWSSVGLPEDSLALALFAAITLPLSLKDKQSILNTADLASILKAERVLLKREAMLLDYMMRAPHTQDSQGPLNPFSPN